jgi:hypothetical protein
VAKTLTNDKVTIKSFRSIRNHGISGEKLPTFLKVLDWGENSVLSGQGKVVLDDRSVNAFSSTQKKIGGDKIALDFEHNTVPGTRAYKESSEPRPVAAYGTPHIIQGDGLYISDIQWTPSGKDNARNYADLSPAPVMEGDRAIGLHSCALTRAGAVDGLSFFSAVDSLDELVKAMGADAYILADKHFNGAKQMTNEHIAYFRKESGLGDGASDDAVMNWLHATYDKMKSAKGPLDAPAPGSSTDAADRGGAGQGNVAGSPGTPHGTITYSATDLQAAIEAAVKPLSAKLDSYTAERDAEKKQDEEKRRNEIVALASREGKVIPFSAETIKTLAVPVLEELVKGLPKATVPIRGILKPLTADGQQPQKRTLKDAAAFVNQHIARITNETTSTN